MEFFESSKKLREQIRSLERKLGILEDNGFSCCGITISQCHALVEIGRAKSISLNQLAQLLNLDNSTMSRTVNNLVTNELAQRNVDPQDRRYVTISLTDKGNQIFKETEDDMNKYFKNIYDAIPKDKKEQVLQSLDILLKAMDESKCCE